MKRKVHKGNRDSDGTIAEMPGEKDEPNLKRNINENIDPHNSKLMEQIDVKHKDKLEQID